MDDFEGGKTFMASIEEESLPTSGMDGIPGGPTRSGRVMIVEDARPTARLLQHLLVKERLRRGGSE